MAEVLIGRFWRKGCGRLQKMAANSSQLCMHTPCKATLQLFTSRKIGFSISRSWSWTHDLLWPMDLINITETEFASVRTWRRPALASRRGHTGEDLGALPGSLLSASLWGKPPAPASCQLTAGNPDENCPAVGQIPDPQIWELVNVCLFFPPNHRVSWWFVNIVNAAIS